jgi:hypothetical protein
MYVTHTFPYDLSIYEDMSSFKANLVISSPNSRFEEILSKPCTHYWAPKL